MTIDGFIAGPVVGQDELNKYVDKTSGPPACGRKGYNLKFYNYLAIICVN